MAFSFVQSAPLRGSFSAGTTGFIVFSSAPTLGNLICVFLVTDSGAGTLTVQDANGNNYAVTPSSPSVGDFDTYLAYLLSAPSNASATVNFTWQNSTGAYRTGGSEFSSTKAVSFDKDAVGAGNTGVSGTTINTPTIIPVQAGELLYAAVGTSSSVAAPVGGGTLGVWTGPDTSSGAGSEYDLSASTSTAVQFTTANPNTGFTSIAGAFRGPSAPSGGGAGAVQLYSPGKHAPNQFGCHIG